MLLLLIEMGAGILIFVLKDKGWVSVRSCSIFSTKNRSQRAYRINMLGVCLCLRYINIFIERAISFIAQWCKNKSMQFSYTIHVYIHTYCIYPYEDNYSEVHRL